MGRFLFSLVVVVGVGVGRLVAVVGEGIGSWVLGQSCGFNFVFWVEVVLMVTWL